MGTIQIAEVALETWGALICLIAAIYLDRGIKVEKRENIPLGYMLAVNCISQIADGIAICFRGEPTFADRCMIYASNFIVFLTMYILGYLSVCYAESHIIANGGTPNIIFKKMARIAAIIYIGLLVISQFTNWFYYIDENNFYNRGCLWLLSQTAMPYFVALSVCMLVIYNKHFSTMQTIVFSVYVIVPISCSIAQLFIYGLSLINTGISLSLVLMLFVYEMEKNKRMLAQAELVTKQKEELLKQQEETFSWQMSTLRAQIQPHFIFNCMSTIQYLCKSDPDLAAEATKRFSLFLRTTIDSFDIKNCVPFEKEMYMVNNYLYLEKIRYGEKLHVEKELEVEDLDLPPFSIQVLVENAVKHGLHPKLEGGTIWIHSYENEDTYFIEVIDNGVGFDPSIPKEEDDRAHVGLENTRKRLKSLCNGRLEIISSPGNGCKSVIQIPKD